MSLKDATGCVITQTITITQPPAIVISTITSNSPICTGNTLLFNSSASGGTGTLTYSWTGPNGFTSNQQNPSIPGATTAASGTYTLTVTDASGCTKVAVLTNVMVNASPVVSINYPGSPYCSGAGTATVVQIGPAGGSYSASPNTLLINGATGAVNVNASPLGSYLVTYLVPASGGCPQVTATTTITIAAQPSATISYPGTIFCVGSGPVDVTLTGTTGGTFSVSPGVGLPFDPSTGRIFPQFATPGPYTITYSIPATAGGCAAVNQTANVTIAPSVTPSFSPIGAVCAGTVSSPLPNTSNNGVNGTWTPAWNNTTTTTYTFTPNPGQCATPVTTTVTINPTVTPTFNPVAPVCAGATLSPLPTTSNNGINGTWSPALNNTTTTTYTFTPTSGTCPVPVTLTINVNPNITPVFDPVAPVCAGATLSPLPTTSNNGINGTWSPALNNTATTTYTFTPTPGQCATTTTLTINVNPNITPVFDPVGPVCAGATISALPTISNNGINGSWSPALNNTATTTYTFTPTPGQCATTTTLTITVNPVITPVFDPVGPVCAGATISALPTISNNGITGTWSPALNNTSTTTYTFTPTAGQCAPTVTMTIVVNPVITPVFDPVGPVCAGSTIGPLPTTSNNGINGTWSPALNTSATTTYTFTPTAGQCASPVTLTITVNPVITPVFSPVGPICAGATLSPLPTISNNGITGTWSPALDNTATTTYTFTPTAGQCAPTVTMTIVVNPNITPVFDPVGPVCAGATLSPLPTTSNNGINGTWSPALNNSSTTTYTFTPAAGLCATTVTMTITVNPVITPLFDPVGPVCLGSAISPLPTTSNNGITGTWSPALNNSATTTYTFTPDPGQCALTTTLTITVTTPPAATISYPNSPYCTAFGIASVVQTGTPGGVYSSSPGLVIDPSTGLINTVTSTPGTYTVNYTMAASGGCSAVTASTTIVIIAQPTASIVYAGSPFCSNSAPGNVTIIGATGGTFSASSPGLTINTTTGQVNPATSTPGTYTVTYSIPPSTGGCGAVTATTTVTINPVPNATISYGSPVFCSSAGLIPVTITGTTGGGFSSSAGLSVNANTGEINTGSSTPGTYTVTYTIIPPGGCAPFTTSTTVTITAAPLATISYPAAAYCTSNAAVAVVQTGTPGGTYSVSPAGLTINTSTGQINPATSTAGNYTITYSVPASGGCPVFTTSTTVSISAPPAATISYPGSPFCANAAPVNVVLTGTTGGTFTSTTGLFINATTGTITPVASTPGTYTVTYTIPASGGCAALTTTATVTITALPTAAISYSGSPFCSNAGTATVTLTGTAGGSYSSTAGLSINPVTGAVNLGASTAGSYTVTYTVAASGGCAAVSANATIVISAAPNASISYPGSPFCNTPGSGFVTLTGTTGGVFSASPSGLSINPSTGEINTGTSTPGAYTVTYIIAPSGGCAFYSVTAPVVINAPPTATIAYPGSPYCSSAGLMPVTITGAPGGVFSVSPAGLSINPSTGAITTNTSTAGTYTVTYTLPAAGGCAAVTTTAPVTITAQPVATIAYAGTPYCTGTGTAAVTLTGATGGSFSASPAGLVLNPLTGAINLATSTPGSYTVSYTIAAGSGCPVVTATTPVAINAVALPVATVDCSQGFGNGIITVSSPTGAGITYSLDGGAFQAGPSFTGVSNGNHTVTVRNATGCTASSTIAVTCGCANAPAITLSSTSGATCGVTAVTISGNTFTNATLVTITENGAGTVTPSSVTTSPFSFTYNPAPADAGTTVTITLTSNNPLGAPCSAATVTYTLTVNANPVVTAGSNSPVCAGGTLNLTATSAGAGAYSWTGPNAFSSASQNPVISAVTAAAAGTYNVTVTDANGCTGTGSTTVVVTSNITPTFAAIGPFCQNAAAPSLPGSSSNGVAGTWNPSVISTATAGTSTYTFTPAANQCALPATLTVTVTPLPSAPTVGLITQPTCTVATGSVVLNNLPAGNWTLNPGGIAGSGTSFTISGLAAGTYSYTVTNAAGCTSVASGPVVINAPPTPPPPPVYNVDCSGGSGNGVITITGTAGMEYSLDAGPFSTTTVFTAVPNGTHTITVRNAAGCTTTTSPFILACGCSSPPGITLSGTSSSTCGVQPVTVSGNSFTNAGTITITENGAGTVSPSSVTASPFSFTYTPAAGDAGNTVTITVSTNNPAGPPCVAATATYTIQVRALPTVSAGSNSPVCTGAVLNLSSLPAGAAGYSWTGPNTYSSAAQNPVIPAVTAAAGGTYTVTVTDANGCSNTASTAVTVNPNTTPAFTQIGPLCQNSTPPPLPASSTNGVTGTWSPATINTATAGTTTYTFTPSGGCAAATTMNIVVTNSITPSFAAIGPLCLNSTPPALPPTSTNGVTGTWSPATISTASAGTTTYTFTPSGGCAVPATMNIVVTNSITPSFTAIGPLCQNSTAPALPATSTNGVAGTWSPATISTATAGTTTYTFTPSGGCAAPVTMNIVVNAATVPAFTAIGPLCQNSTAPALPASSTNGITGTWSPATISTATAGTSTYTFTPSSGCASTTTMSIVVNAPTVPSFASIGPLCQNSTAPVLPATSTNGITGTWSPATISTASTGTTTYTFTPTSGCAATTTLSIVVISSITPAFNTIGPLCQNSTAPALPASSTNGISGTWSPALINTSVPGTANYTFTPGANQCAAPVTISVSIVAPTPPIRYTSVFTQANTPLQLTARAIGSVYLWTPATGLSSATISNPVFNYNQQTEYTVAITNAAGCRTVDTQLVRIAPPPPKYGDIQVPKAWSPNGDGHNDKLVPFTINIRQLNFFRIFNRWGQLVYETNVIGQGWDGLLRGQPQGTDTFRWMAEGVGTDGTLVRKTGSSVLIR